MKPEFCAHTPSKDSDIWHELKEHLGDVANLARQFAEKFGAGELAYYAGLWHDLGKYNPEFQKYLKDCHRASITGAAEPKSRVPHAIYGAKLAAEALSPLAPIIYGHHGGLPQRSHMKSRLVAVEVKTDKTIRNLAKSDIELIPKPGYEQEVKVLAKEIFSFELLIRMVFSCLVDADYLDTEEHFDPQATQQRGTNITPELLWERLKEAQDNLRARAKPTAVNNIRAEVYQSCLDSAQLKPGVFRLAVPTGGGKTRSGLAFALAHAVKHAHDRVIVAVPYTSIIEQTVQVYRDIFGDAAVLEHHSAIQSDKNNTEDARRLQAQARLATQNWDAPLVVTTTVQLLESLFANRPSRCRKVHNIANSVVILDEVQTLPIGLLKPIVSVLQGMCQQYNMSLVLCTATQPALEGNSPYFEGFDQGSVQDIIQPENAKQHFQALSRVNYEIPKQPWNWSDVANDANKSEQALIILNTRKDALNVLEELLETQADGDVMHLSTLLCGTHRREVLAQVKQKLKHKQPCYLVSTQVVEAGVDLDFPLVYRAVGPLDRIVQAAGRCNREGNLDGKGRVVIFTPIEGKAPPGEYKTAFDETSRLLKRETLNFDDPGIFEAYFRSLYQGIETDKHGIQPLRAKPMDYPEVAKRFKLIPDDTTAVVIRYDDEVNRLIKQIKRRGLKPGDHRRLQPYLVNLRDREFRATEDLREEIAPGVWVWHGNYDPIRGIAIGDNPIVRDPADLIF